MTTTVLFSLLACLPTGTDVAFVRHDDRVDVGVGGQPFAAYVFRDTRIPRPYFAHLRAPGGIQVTRNHPPVAGKDATDHELLHPGLWLAFGDLSGADFWRNRALVRHVEFVEPPTADEKGGRFAVKNRYQAGDRTICEEVCRIDIRPREEGCWILWDSRFGGNEEFSFGDQEEMGLGVRVATPIAVKNGGKLTNADGLTGEKEIWGKQSNWCDYSGTVDGKDVGVALMPDPANFRRSWFHARDYGFVAANPFGRNAFTKGEKSKITVPAGQSLRLRFAVLVHSGPTDLATAYAEALAAFAASP